MDNSKDGIVLLAKQPGPTSFSCLFDVKHALNTTKAGHTGTLDSFAQGLLVVCTGRLTRLAGNIIELDKSYEAIIKFGEETDTLEPLGNVILQKKLPSLENLKSAVQKYTCTYNQKPPVFSSIHIDGKRASDLVRQGSEIEMKSRAVTVYSAEIIDVKLNSDNLVEYAKTVYMDTPLDEIQKHVRNLDEFRYVFNMAQKNGRKNPEVFPFNKEVIVSDEILKVARERFKDANLDTLKTSTVQKELQVDYSKACRIKDLLKNEKNF